MAQGNKSAVSTSSGSINENMFSPIELFSSRSFQGKNLTGNTRHVRDIVANLHANIQQWNNLHLQGLNYLKDIVQEKQDENYSDTLQNLCEKLETVCDGLDNIVRNLDQIRYQLKAMPVLQKTEDKLFITWPTTKFGDVMEKIYEMYYQEAKLKRNIFENVAHNHTETWKMFHLTAWVHQSLLSEHFALLEALLIETGHK